MDPGRNADYAAGILSSNLQRFGGNVREALSAYNAGSPTATGTRTDWGDGKPVGYADSVLRHLARLGGSAAAAAEGSVAASSGSTQGSGTSGAVNALQSLFQQLTGGGAGAGGGITLSLPQYQPLAKPDQRDFDTAPSAVPDNDDAS